VIPGWLALVLTLIALLACCFCGVWLDGDARRGGVSLALAFIIVILPQLTKEPT
jgi:hypothetical protein